METQWWNLKAPELRDLAKKDAVVIIPVASTEQHGPHLPTQVDCLLVGEIARRTAEQASKSVPTIVTPVVWTGLAEHHMSLGATISLDFDSFFTVLRGVSTSLTRHGFRKILLLNGHGGNIAALTVIVNELAPALDAPIATTTYWLLAQPAFAKILEKQANVRHACEAETSMVLALKPELVDMSQATNAVGPTAPELATVIGTAAAHRWQSFRVRTSHGAIGDPRAASAEKGERLLAAAADAVAALITKNEFWNAPA
jgi:creatinine amidohydrolase